MMTLLLCLAAQDAFATDLYGELSKEEGNLFFSPYSISTALTMTYAGARGTTAEQMAGTLHLSLEGEALHKEMADRIASLNEAGKKKGTFNLSVANSLWGQEGYPFKADFRTLLEKSYGAGLRDVNFGETEAARKRINDWVEEQTKSRIKDLFPEGVLNVDTRLVLVNAIYFKGQWVNQFEPSATKKAPFRLSADKSADVATMRQEEHFKYAETDSLLALGMPYVGDRASMIVLLPKEADGLAALEKALTAELLADVVAKLEWTLVDVSLPKFKMTSQFSLGETLKTMGMTDAFGGGADFSGIAEAERLYIQAVVHKAFVDVDEEGTEAAAATGVAVGAESMPPEPKVFRADHPFIFVIRDEKTGAILFMGRVADPS